MSNSSARISQIEDVRAPGGTYTWQFTYNTDAIPHLTQIASNGGIAEGYTLSYLENQRICCK